MDLYYCTTPMVNRSNYRSVLKKRKSSNKKNVTVKLKRNSGDTQTMSDSDGEDVNHNQQKSNDTMCLICRKRSECSKDESCAAAATLRQQHHHHHQHHHHSQQQQQQSKHENDIRDSQSCTNCVVDRATALSRIAKWYSSCQLKNALWKNDGFSGCSSRDRPGGSSSGSLLPSPTQPSVLLTPAAHKTPPPQLTLPLSISSRTTKAPSSSSSSIRLEMWPWSRAEATTKNPSSSVSSQSLRTNPSASSSFTSTSSIHSHSSSDESHYFSHRNCGGDGNNTSRSGRVLSASVLRTFAFIIIVLEKCLTGMFGTRQRMPNVGHDIDNRVKRRQSKRSNNSFPLPKYPIVYLFLMFSLVTLMLPTSASAEVRLQRNETVCKSRDIRNSPSEFRHLTNCTVIEGFLLITLIERNSSDYEAYSFPLLTEVTEFVMIYRVNGLRSLSTLFPNLSVIRGKELFEGFALVIYDNKHLEDVGLPSLTTVTRGAVRIEKNPEMCFVETIDWTQIAISVRSDQHFFRANKAKCPLCPGDSDKPASEGTELSINCTPRQGQRYCWNSKTCQKICPATCKNNCNDDLECCDEACIGGCAKKNPSSCTSCRHFAKLDVCIDKCPANFFSYLDRRCVTAETCTRDIGTKLEGTKQEYLVPFNGICSVRCPPGHNKINATCVKCEGKCVKKCEGGVIDSVAAAKSMHGCTHIIKKPLVISIKRGGRHLMEELESGLSSIEEIDNYLKVHRTYGIVSLAFFKNLTRIKGESLESDKFALYVLENQDLESIWGPNQTVKMDEGRVFFHFNPKLCYSVIDSLRPSLKNASQFDRNEVASDSNGSKGSCNTTDLDVKIVKVLSGAAKVVITNPMKFEDDRTFIGYQYFHTEDPYRNVSMFGQRPCDDSWSSEDPTKSIEHVFTKLKPFTQYAFYVKTHTISTEPRNGQSPIMFFRTKSDQPKTVQNLNAVANSSSEIIVHWLRPTVTNGNLTKYIITATLDTSDREKLKKSRNYCNDPLKETETGEAPRTVIEKSDPDCKCEKNVTRKDGINPQYQEAMYENIIDFENNMQNFVYVKQTNDSADRHRRRRAVDVYNSTPATSTLPPPNFEGISRMDKAGYYYEYVIGYVNASVTEFVLTKLKHFSSYTISVKACRAPEVDAPDNECSVESTTNARTLKLHNVDIIRNLQVELEQLNTTRGNLRIKWDPPERPNSLVVSYTIFYIVANSPDAVQDKRCITELDYQQNFTNGYLITGLPTGNYSVRVRANSLAGEGIKSEPVYMFIPENETALWKIILGVCIGILIVICIVAYIVHCFCKRNAPSDLKIFPTVNPYYVSMQYLADEWEVPREKIIQLRPLGQGSFGMVYEGILKNFNDQEDTPCAIKTVNENATDRERLNFLKEASVMKQFNTHHVVRLLGVCSRGQPALVIMELMKYGDLKAYLRQHRPDAEPMAYSEAPIRPPTLSRILQIAIEIADGMAYLAAKKYVHRDLAARNCMVAADLTVKIGDFGMTRDVYETDYYRKGTKGLLPVRWMSPESLKDGVFSSASDVFSYGVVLWEMATLASQPYQGFSNDQVLRFVIDGGVMDRPENCPDKLYKLMRKCWEHRPTARPSFMEIIRYLLDSVDPKFQEVSFYHSAEAKDLLEQMHPEHDMDDVTTPLRVGELDYKVDIDDNSSVEPHESPALDEDDDDDDDDDDNDNVQPHSPYSLGSAIMINNSTPGGHSKHSSNILMNQSNPSLLLPSTSAAAIAAASLAIPETDDSLKYVHPDTGYRYNKQQEHLCPSYNIDESTTAKNPTPPAQKAIKNNNSSSATSKYPNSLKQAVASTVQNVSNSLVPLRIPNMNFLHHLFKNSSNLSSSGGKGQRNSSGTKSETSSNNGNNNNSNVSSMTANVETGSTGSRFFHAITPSHTSKNPNYQILDESFPAYGAYDDIIQMQNRLPTTKSQTSLGTTQPPDGGEQKNNKNNGSNITQLNRNPEQRNLNRDNSNLSTSSNKPSHSQNQIQTQNQNQIIIDPSSAQELSSSSGVSSPIRVKDNGSNSDASKVISKSTPTTTSTTPAIRTPLYQLKENWLRQYPQMPPPNGFIGHEG